MEAFIEKSPKQSYHYQIADQNYVDYGKEDWFSFIPSLYVPIYETHKRFNREVSFEQTIGLNDECSIEINHKKYRIPLALKHIADQVKESKELLNYTFNWDDNGALPTNGLTFTNAASFVIDYAEYIFKHSGIRLKAPYIDILKDGSVSVHWENAGAQFLIIFKIDSPELAYYYAEREDNKVPLKSAIEPGKPVDEILALWMRKNLN